MYIEEIRNTDRCVGCGNCMNVCPVRAVTMVQNAEGFSVPNVEQSKCTNCHKCEGSCPLGNLKYRNEKQLPNALLTRWNDTDALIKTASGGLCSILAEYILRQNGYVCGAVYDAQFRVQHIVSNKPEDIIRMRQSKYVQSDLNHCFPIIKEKLDNGICVLFIGVTCQVYALKKFLRKDYANLFCADLICHGVPSPLVQEEYVRYLEQRHGTVAFLENRHKRLYPHTYCSTYCVKYQSGKTVIRQYSDDPMADAFYSRLSVRKSCFQCAFKTIRRISDLTIGDFWFSEDFGMGEDRYGVNLVLVQSEKGHKLLELISDRIIVKKIDTETAVKLNGGRIYSPSEENPNRSAFFEELGKLQFDKLVTKYNNVPSKVKLKNKIRIYIAPLLRLSRYYNQQHSKSGKTRLKRIIPEDKKGLLYYDD